MSEREYVPGAILQYEFGWFVRCPLCRKKSERSFLKENTDARMNAERYWRDHLASPMHAEAVEAARDE